MQQKLIELNLKNVKILVNSKDLEILNKKNIKRNYNVPYKLILSQSVDANRLEKALYRVLHNNPVDVS